MSEQDTLKLKRFVASELQRNCVTEQNSFASKLHFILAEHPFKLSLSHITLPTQTSLSHICVDKKKKVHIPLLFWTATELRVWSQILDEKRQVSRRPQSGVRSLMKRKKKKDTDLEKRGHIPVVLLCTEMKHRLLMRRN